MDTAATLEEAVKETIDMSSIPKENFVLECLRHSEAKKYKEDNPFGFGNCKSCTPDYLAKKYHKDYIPNNWCRGYIPCRSFNVISK